MFFETDTNNNSNGPFSITRQGVSSFYIDDNRNVGIGTTSPVAALHVQSSSTKIFLSNTDFNTSTSTGSGLILHTGASSGNTYGMIYAFQSGNTSYANLVVPGGNVGIGTTSPQVELHVKGNNGWGEVRVEGQTFASGHGGSLEFYSEGTALADIYANTSKDLILRTNGSTERMRITSAGNIGIRTSSPGTSLDVVGTVRFGANTSQSLHAALNVSAGQASATTYRDIDLHGSWSSGEGHAITATHGTGVNQIVGQVVFEYNGPGSKIKWGRLYHSGDSNAYTMQLVSSSTTAANLNLTGNFVASGDVTAFSDARIKTNVQTIENALDKTLQLRGVTYNRTDTEETSTKVGVIAQEILEVIPEVVNQNEDGMYSVSYGNLTAVLIEAIKEQQKQIDELKQIINGFTK